MSNQSSFLADLNDIAALTVTGAQAGQFLQSQFTCDVQALSAGHAVLGACCDHKGRMLVNGWIGREGNEWILFIPKNMLASTLTHLQKFAAFSKVGFSEKMGWKVLSYFAPEAATLAASAPELIHHQVPSPGEPSYLLHNLFGPEASIHFMRAKLQEGAQLIDEATLLVMARLVLIHPATRELFIPQMIGLEKLGGVSFQKGCYVGQEVVARIQHLGQLKRHLYTLNLASESLPAIGDPLTNATQEVIGHIAAVSKSSLGDYSILAVIQDLAVSNPVFYKNIMLPGVTKETKSHPESKRCQ